MSERGGEQRRPVDGKGDILEEIRARLAERRAYGIAEYGKPLQAFNGRDAFRDAEEELLDWYAYLSQGKAEHRALVEAVRVLVKHARGEEVNGATLGAALELGQVLEELHGRG